MVTDAKESSDSSSEHETAANSDVESATTGDSREDLVDTIFESLGGEDDKPDEQPEEEAQEDSVDPSAAEKEETTEDAEEEEGESEEESESEGGEEPEGEDDAEEEEDAETSDRFDKHPRFQKLIQEKNEAKSRIEELEPLAKEAQGIRSYLDDNGLSVDEFNQGMEIMSALRNDPERALKALAPIIDQLNQVTGSQVVSEDLNQKIDEGLIDEETARETEKLRAREKLNEAEKQRQMAKWQEAQQKQTVERIRQTYVDWDASQQNDPDWGMKKPLVDEWIQTSTVPVNSPEDALRVFNDILDRVNRTLAVASPQKAKPTRKQPQATSGRPAQKKYTNPVDEVWASMGQQ